MVCRLKRAYEESNDIELDYILSPRKRGRQCVLTEDEELVLKEEIKVASSMSFAVDIDGMRTMMARIADDGTERQWNNGVPIDDAIRSFCARTRDITYRKLENKEYAKLKAERYEHVKSFFNAMEVLKQRNEGITSNGDRMWNLDETAIDLH